MSGLPRCGSRVWGPPGSRLASVRHWRWSLGLAIGCSGKWRAAATRLAHRADETALLTRRCSATCGCPGIGAGLIATVPVVQLPRMMSATKWRARLPLSLPRVVLLLAEWLCARGDSVLQSRCPPTGVGGALGMAVSGRGPSLKSSHTSPSCCLIGTASTSSFGLRLRGIDRRHGVSGDRPARLQRHGARRSRGDCWLHRES